jgi:hypothetical protein
MAIGRVNQLRVVLLCKECGKRYEYDPSLSGPSTNVTIPNARPPMIIGGL